MMMQIIIHIVTISTSQTYKIEILIIQVIEVSIRISMRISSEDHPPLRVLSIFIIAILQIFQPMKILNAI